MEVHTEIAELSAIKSKNIKHFNPNETVQYNQFQNNLASPSVCAAKDYNKLKIYTRLLLNVWRIMNYIKFNKIKNGMQCVF